MEDPALRSNRHTQRAETTRIVAGGPSSLRVFEPGWARDGGDRADAFIGASAATRRIIDTITRLSRLDSTVLVSGESGVGKSLLAHLIHRAGSRAARAFVTVRCAALPRGLMEAELFGYEKGAFTGAYERRLGRIEAVHGGTLFLDEIADLPLDLQPKLLQFLHERTCQRLGSSRTMAVQVRVIAASNQDLQALCRKQRFRKDLYYRLNVVPVHIPPLRERREDIPVLAAHLLNRLSRQRRRTFQLTPEAERALYGYEWPGNVRELDNVLQRATVFSRGPQIALADLPPELHPGPTAGHAGCGTLAGHSWRDLERIAIQQTLEACHGNMAETARQLGVSKKGMYLKVKRLGLAPSPSRI